MPAPVYNNTPNAIDRISATQAPIQTNFVSLNTSFNVNHYQIDDAANWGKHLFVQLPVQAPAPTFAAGETGIYTFANPTTGKNELYVHKQTQAGTAEVAMTASTLSSVAPSNNQDGWTKLPSGIILAWYTVVGTLGTAVTDVNIGGTVVDVFTNIFAVLPTPYWNDTGATTYAVRLVSITSNTVFRLKATGLTTAKCLIIGV